MYLLRKIFQSLLLHIYTKGIEGLDLQDCAADLSARFDQFVEIFKWLFKLSSTWLVPVIQRIGC